MMTVMLLSLVCAAAVFYLWVTGPYWQMMESSMKHPDFHVYVQKMEASFDRWRVDSSDLLDEDYQSIFDGEFEMDSPTKAAVLKFANEHSAKVNATISLLMRDVLITTRAPLKDFLEGGKYSTPLCYAEQKTLQHCPLTNLMGGNAFGDMDFDMGKWRHTTFHHHSTTQMLARNKMSDWLAQKEVDEAAKLLSLARGRVCVSVATTDSKKKKSPSN